MLELGVKTLLCYLLGSLIGSLIVGKLRGGVDIRKLGSGNPGGTNALRTQGPAFALWVILIDAGKGWLAATVIPNLPLVAADPAVDRLWLAVACAAAVVVGHVYPLWYGFRGGKGAATLVGVLLGLDPVALVPVLAVWLLVVTISGFVGLATILATVAFPVYVVATAAEPSLALLSFGCAGVLFICYTHRLNIERMRAGTESRAQRLWLLRKR